MMQERELNEATLNLLEFISDLKKDIKSSMMKREVSVLNGIIFFEAVVKEENPKEINDETIQRIKKMTNVILRRKEEELQQIDTYMHYGINKGFLLLDNYESIKMKKLSKKTEIL